MKYKAQSLPCLPIQTVPAHLWQREREGRAWAMADISKCHGGLLGCEVMNGGGWSGLEPSSSVYRKFPIRQLLL